MLPLFAFLKGVRLTGPALGIAVAAVVLFGAYFKGRFDERALCVDRINAEREAHYKQAMEEQQKAVTAATEWGKQIGKQRVVIKTVVKEVERLIESSPVDPVCFNDDGVRLVNSAIGAGADAPERNNGTLPAPATPRRWAGEYHSDSFGGYDRQVPLMQSEARSLDFGAQSSTDSRVAGTVPKYAFHSAATVENGGR